MARVSEVAGKKGGGRAQAVTCIQNLPLGVRIFQQPMIAQSIYHGISRFDSRGRKLGLKSLETHARREGERLGDDDREGGFKILTVAVRRFRAFQSPGVAVPSLMVTFELKAQARPVAAESLVVVAREDSGVSLDQLVVIAEEPEGNRARAVAGHALDYP